MLPKSQRLNLGKEFKQVAAGRRVETKYLRLFVKFADNRTSRVGIASSGRIFKKATERNRVRRLASSAFESLYSQLPENINIAALPKAGILGVKSGEVLADLKEGLKREKII